MALGRPHKPAELGPRIYRRGRYWHVDLRPWRLSRRVMRSPADPGWPEAGERTELREVAEEWKWAYVELIRDEHVERVLGRRRRSLPALPVSVSHYLSYRERMVAHNTFRADRTATGLLVEHMPGLRASDVSTTHLQRMVDALLEGGYRPSSLRTYLRSLGPFFRWLRMSNPAESVTLPREKAGDPVTWTDAEVETLRKAASRVGQMARLALEIGLNMGLRQAEIFALHGEWINVEARTARIQYQLAAKGVHLVPPKSGRPRTVHVLPEWWGHHRHVSGLLVHEDGKVMREWSQRLLIAGILEEAGLNSPGVGWHALRHTYARRYVSNFRGDIHLLQISLGHSSVTVTERAYGHWRPDSAAVLARRQMYGE